MPDHDTIDAVRKALLEAFDAMHKASTANTSAAGQWISIILSAARESLGSPLPTPQPSPAAPEEETLTGWRAECKIKGITDSYFLVSWNHHNWSMRHDLHPNGSWHKASTLGNGYISAHFPTRAAALAALRAAPDPCPAKQGAVFGTFNAETQPKPPATTGGFDAEAVVTEHERAWGTRGRLVHNAMVQVVLAAHAHGRAEEVAAAAARGYERGKAVARLDRTPPGAAGEGE